MAKRIENFLEKIGAINTMFMVGENGRRKRFEDFQRLHRQIAGMLDLLTIKKIGTIPAKELVECGDTKSCGVEFSAKDVAWWATRYDTFSDVIFKPISEIERIFYAKIADALDRGALPSSVEDHQNMLKLVDEYFLNVTTSTGSTTE